MVDVIFLNIFYLIPPFLCIFIDVVWQKRKEKDGDRKRKLEREIEEELGDDYVLDLNKNYDLPDKEKYDKIPEIWEGHNVYDFVDPQIFQVRMTGTVFICIHALLLSIELLSDIDVRKPLHFSVPPYPCLILSSICFHFIQLPHFCLLVGIFYTILNLASIFN